jgi:hypothetical protein
MKWIVFAILIVGIALCAGCTSTNPQVSGTSTPAPTTAPIEEIQNNPVTENLDYSSYQEEIELGNKSVKNFKFEDAKSSFEFASRSSVSKNPVFLNNYAVVLAFLNKDQEALIQINEAASKDPSNAIISKNKIFIYNVLNKAYNSDQWLYFKFDDPLYQIDMKHFDSGIHIGKRVYVSGIPPTNNM